MRTHADFVARVNNDLKAYTKDGRISQRHILAIGIDKTYFLVSQKLDELTLSRERGIITEIPCVEMEDVPVMSCEILEFRDCRTIKRSKLKIPGVIYGKVGSGISQVTPTDGAIIGEFEYKPTTPKKYRRLKRLQYSGPKIVYYALIEDYLYLLNSEAEAVNVSTILLEKWLLKDISTCCEEDPCKSYWDYEFVCPDRFYDLIVQYTLTEVANIWRTSQEDTNPNLDPNLKSKTTA